MDNSNTANPNNQPQVNRNQQQGTGFTNLSRVIGANQNNNLSGAVGGGLQNQANNVKSGIQSASQNTNTAIQGQNNATDANKQQAQTIINDPTKATDQDVDKFSQFRSGSYAGPTELQNKQNLQNETAQAQSLGGMAGSQAGRQALLQRFVGGANYGQGKQMLDSAILGQTGGNQLSQAARSTNGLGQQLNQADTAAQQQAQLVAGGNQAFATDVKNQLNSGLNTIGTSAQNNINTFNNTRDNLLNGIKTAGAYDPSNPQNSTLTAEQYKALTDSGYDPNDKLGLYNLNLGDYVQRSDFNPTLSSALDTNQAARAQALAKLSGTDINQTNQALAQAAGDTANVGTLANQKAIQFNQDQFAQAQNDAIENEIKQFYDKSNISNNNQYTPQTSNFYIPNSDALVAGLKAGTLSSQQLAEAGGLNLANTSIKKDTFDPMGSFGEGGIGDPHRYDSGATDYTANGGQANLLAYLKNLQGTQDYYKNDMGFGDTGTLVGGSGFSDFNKQYGGLRQLLNPTPAPTTPAAPAANGLVGDNSSNAALKAAIANMNGGQ